MKKIPGDAQGESALFAEVLQMRPSRWRMSMVTAALTLQRLAARDPFFSLMAERSPVWWRNTGRKPVENALADILYTYDDVLAAASRFDRFAPFLLEQLAPFRFTRGLLDSPLQEQERLKQHFASAWEQPLAGKFFVKDDGLLPLVGVAEARGVFHHVMALAEKLGSDIIPRWESTTAFSRPEAKKRMGQYILSAGATGNFGLALGAVASAFGFTSLVHVPDRTESWKKHLLYQCCSQVVCCHGGPDTALSLARAASESEPLVLLMDCENSSDIFLGFATAGLLFKNQIQAMEIAVDENHPLCVYLPCSSGLGAAGIAFGLKLAFGEHVFCYTGEPVETPAMLLGVASGFGASASCLDLGLLQETAGQHQMASRPSAMGCEIMHHIIDGMYTVSDKTTLSMLAGAARSQGVRFGPSAMAGLAGIRLAAAGKLDPVAALPGATHVVWSFGDELPLEAWVSYIRKAELAHDAAGEYHGRMQGSLLPSSVTLY